MNHNPKVTLIVGLVILVTGVSIFFFGVHSFDIAVNLMNVQYQFDMYDMQITIYETNIAGQKIELDDLYRRGIGQILLGFYVAILGAFMIGYVLRRLK